MILTFKEYTIIEKDVLLYISILDQKPSTLLKHHQDLSMEETLSLNYPKKITRKPMISNKLDMEINHSQDPKDKEKNMKIKNQETLLQTLIEDKLMTKQ